MSVRIPVFARILQGAGILPRRDRQDEFNSALGDLKVLDADLGRTTRPADRSRLYDDMAATYRALGRTVDPDAMPALTPGEGSSYARAYADMAGICELLAFGERVFAGMSTGVRYRPPQPPAFFLGCPAAEREMWVLYLACTNREARAGVLFILCEVTGKRIGTDAASVLNMAGWAERSVAGRHAREVPS